MSVKFGSLCSKWNYNITRKGYFPAFIWPLLPSRPALTRLNLILPRPKDDIHSTAVVPQNSLCSIFRVDQLLGRKSPCKFPEIQLLILEQILWQSFTFGCRIFSIFDIFFFDEDRCNCGHRKKGDFLFPTTNFRYSLWERVFELVIKSFVQMQRQRGLIVNELKEDANEREPTRTDATR